MHPELLEKLVLNNFCKWQCFLVFVKCPFTMFLVTITILNSFCTHKCHILSLVIRKASVEYFCKKRHAFWFL